MRRVVVGTNAEGRSYVESDEDVDLGPIWQTDPSSRGITDLDEAHAAVAIEPPTGGTQWLYAEMPPHSAPRSEPMPAGVDERGFHATRTIDYAYFIDGPVMLDVDEGSVEICAGDCVVMQAANHAWRNLGDRPVRVLGVLVSLT